jgi:hypothetical protein
VINTKVAPNILFYLLAKSHNFLRPLAISFYLIPILCYWKIEINFKNPFLFLTGLDPLTHLTRIMNLLHQLSLSLSLSMRHYQVDPDAFTVPCVGRPFFLSLTHLRLLPPIPSPDLATRASPTQFQPCAVTPTFDQACPAAFPRRTATPLPPVACARCCCRHCVTTAAMMPEACRTMMSSLQHAVSCRMPRSPPSCHIAACIAATWRVPFTAW